LFLSQLFMSWGTFPAKATGGRALRLRNTLR